MLLDGFRRHLSLANSSDTSTVADPDAIPGNDMFPSLAKLADNWRSLADQQRRFGAETHARILEYCADELAIALRLREEELLDLRQASIESGYSADHLGRLVRDGKLPNAGRRNAPKIRRIDLPRRPDQVTSAAKDADGGIVLTGTPRANTVSFERIARGALVSKRR